MQQLARRSRRRKGSTTEGCRAKGDRRKRVAMIVRVHPETDKGCRRASYDDGVRLTSKNRATDSETT